MEDVPQSSLNAENLEIEQMKEDLFSMNFEERKKCRTAAHKFMKEIQENPKLLVGYLLRKLEANEY